METPNATNIYLATSNCYIFNFFSNIRIYYQGFTELQSFAAFAHLSCSGMFSHSVSDGQLQVVPEW